MAILSIRIIVEPQRETYYTNLTNKQLIYECSFFIGCDFELHGKTQDGKYLR